MIHLKSSSEIAAMKTSGEMLSKVMETIYKNIRVGVTTKELDQIAYNAIKGMNAKPSFLNYHGFPGTICASVNEEVVHGFPSSRKLEEGDIIGIDMGLIFKGYHSDMARTFAIGEISKEKAKLIEVTRQCFWNGLKFAKIGNRIGDIGCEIQRTAEENGYGVVRELCGHGIGKNLHEEPEVPNFGKAGHGIRISEGLVIAIEPMINLGTKNVKTLKDGWTVVTADNKPSCHYENTIAITENGPIPLTKFEVD